VIRRALVLLAVSLVAPPAAAQAARVEVMVVGREAVLREPAAVRLAPRTVLVRGRRCAAGAATPLSALLGARVRVRLRDYGACGRRARDAGGLFVTQVGADRNAGRDGWVYKVGRRLGTTPAADPSGPFGTGRGLRHGQRLTWFWCVLDRADGCQPTLEVRPERTAVAPGGVLRVRVRAYGDAGRGRPAAGATVTLGGSTATAGADGTAVLTVPATPGRLALTAERAGSVRAFPRRVAVR